MLRSFVIMATAAVLMLALSGCASSNQERKMLSEDIEVLEVFAPEIRVLQDPRYRTNSQEKYLAAKKLAEGVDFSLTRSVETLEQIFLPADALITRSVEYGDEIAFYYNYQNNYVRFRFWRTKNVITESEVRIK
ncbi:MAG: hypothetical protein E7056_02760 [Lentisphaerae bacterium]|nr:hypothetical protein [Lentisphaerota bacterium]